MSRTTDPAPVEVPSASPSAESYWPYILPIGLFLLLTSFEGYLPHDAAGRVAPGWYFGYYSLKLAAVVAAMVAGRAAFRRDLGPWPNLKVLGAAVALGLVVIVAWIGLERLPYPRIPLAGPRQGFDPAVLSPGLRAAFLAVRLLGLIVVVPLFEELFWRSFLMRWVVDQEFWKVPVGHVTAVSAVVTSALFAAAHPEWLPALLTGLAWAGLLAWSRSLLACVISHVVANLALGLYVLQTGAWELW